MRLHRAPAGRPRSRGQSLVEFALVAPVLLLILLLVIDLGRAFYSWVVMQNASRIGANFAGVNAEAWETDPDNATIVAQYNALIEDDTQHAACDESWGGGDPPSPTFTDSAADTSGTGQTPDTAYDVGDAARVDLDCDFHPLTPLISAIVGDDVQLSASSEFRIRAGDIAGLNNDAKIPPPSNSTPTPTPTTAPTPTGTAGPTPTGTAAPTATPGCITVPDLVNPAPETVSQARTEWTNAGFTGTFTPASGQTNKTVLTQSVAPGACAAPNTSVTVTYSN